MDEAVRSRAGGTPPRGGHPIAVERDSDRGGCSIDAAPVCGRKRGAERGGFRSIFDPEPPRSAPPPRPRSRETPARAPPPSAPRPLPRSIGATLASTVDRRHARLHG